jgi:hypothetical protein
VIEELSGSVAVQVGGQLISPPVTLPPPDMETVRSLVSAAVFQVALIDRSVSKKTVQAT